MDATCEKITMEKHELLKTVDWIVDRIHHLAQENDYESAVALQEEFDEWLSPNIFLEVADWI